MAKRPPKEMEPSKMTSHDIGTFAVAAVLAGLMLWGFYIVGDDHPMIKDGLVLFEVRQTR